MDQKQIEKSIIKTLMHFERNDSVLTFDELFTLTDTLDLKANIKKPDFESALSFLIESNHVKKSTGDVVYYGLSENFSDRVKPVKNISMPVRSFILFSGIIDPIFLKKDQKASPHFFVVVKKDSYYISKFLISRHLKSEVEIYEEDQVQALFKDKNLSNAYKLISIKPISNPDKFYEKWHYKNLWIFSYLGNYPLVELNVSYKSMVQPKPVSFIVRTLNKLLKK